MLRHVRRPPHGDGGPRALDLPAHDGHPTGCPSPFPRSRPPLSSWRRGLHGCAEPTAERRRRRPGRRRCSMDTYRLEEQRHATRRRHSGWLRTPGGAWRPVS
jgi:hypothetical protein